MTKIKNTKKGMAKKTLSVSLAVAMLATSNVPVWAAEDLFSAGEAVEAPAVVAEANADAFSAEPVTEAPVVNDVNDEAVASAKATEKALYIDSAEFGTAVTFGENSVLKNSEGKEVTVFDYEWLVNGMQPADENGQAVANTSGTVRLGGVENPNVLGEINMFTPGANHVGGKLTLKITGVKGTNADFEGFTYETAPVTISARDINKVLNSISQVATLTYDGTSKSLLADESDISLNFKDGNNREGITASDFTFKYTGDTVNATTDDKKVKVTATINKAGYKGSINFDMTIGQRTPALYNEEGLTDKTKNDLAVSLKKTQFKYTGENLDLLEDKANNFTLKSNLSGNTLSTNAITGVTYKEESNLINAGDSDYVKVYITKTGDTELDRNYARGAFDSNAGIGYYTAEKVSIIARNLSECSVDDISVDSDILSEIDDLDDLKEYLVITDGDETFDASSDLLDEIDIEGDLVAIKEGGRNSYTLTLKPVVNNKNITGSKTFKLRVVKNSLTDATLTTTGSEIISSPRAVSNTEELSENTIFRSEGYTGKAIEKTSDQLGDIKVTGTNPVDIDEGTDYQIFYKKNTNVTGNNSNNYAEIWIRGIGDWGGQQCIGKFEIEPATIESDSITVPETVSYDGSKTSADEYLSKSDIKVQAETYTWTKKANGTFEETTKLIDVPTELYKTTFEVKSDTLVSNKIADGTEIITTVDKADDVDKTAKAYANYAISQLPVEAEKTTTVCTLSVANADVTVVGAPFTYTGKEITPELVVKDGNRELVKDVDYEVVKTENGKNAGTASITIKGKGEYSSAKTKTVNFVINKANLADVTIVPDEDSIEDEFTYTGEKLTPELVDYVIKLGDVTLTTDVNDFKVTYPASSKENVNAGKEAGSGVLTVKTTVENPNFTGTKEFKFDIEQATLQSEGVFTLWKDGKVVTSTEANSNSGSVTDILFTNDGTAHEFDKVTYKPSNDGYKEGVDYEIKYFNNIRGPIAAIYVNALGNYKNDAENKFNDDTTTYTDAKFFKIDAIAIRKSDVKVANTEYAGGIAVKPTVTVTVGGNELVEGLDYKVETSGDCVNVTAKDKVLKAKLYAKDGYVLDAATWGSAYHSATATEVAYVDITWKVIAKDLANTTVTAYKDNTGKVVVTVMNGSVKVPETEYDVTENEDGTITVTAKADSKNYTGSAKASIGKDDSAIGTPMISDVQVVGNKATVILSGECDGATGYDYVISKDRDCITNKNYDKVNKNILTTETDVTYVQQGKYYAYCHAWKRVDGKKVFSDWSNAYPFVVTAITPDQPVITDVKANGSTVTVTYTQAANADGYDVVLGTTTKKVAGENRPVNYGELVKKNIKGNVVTATFKNVPAGTYYAGLHAWNRTSEDGKKVFSPWSNTKTVTVK